MNMRVALLLSLMLVLIPGRGLWAAPHADTLDPSGYFYIQDRPPKAFRDVEHINIDREPLVGSVGFNWSGEVSLRRGNKLLRLPFAQVHVKGIQIAFVTRTVQGIHYAFSGRFLRVGRYATMQPPGVVLVGDLSRVGPSGKSVAPLRFTYFVGD